MAAEFSGDRSGAPDDMMKILVATDNHIGYMEKDPVRFNDSLESFEEILKYAESERVDFILLGGDLYHDNKPSRQTLCRSMELLRKYCMGDRPCLIEYCSNPEKDFHHSKFQGVNYEDPNYNVSFPIFSIHGNHDDPVGEGSLSAMDILHVSNLINYFGKVSNIEEISISPLLLRKGRTNLALYGLGSCRDERLHRMFRKGKVKFLRPSEGQRDWFNILVLHQNRAKHGATNYIPPSFIPDFFDLVIWGHEHECLIEPEFVPTGTETEEGEEKGIYISQPGSSVATSLSDGEQKPKCCGLLCVKNDCTFKMESIRLRSVRPFLLDSLSLRSTDIHPQDNDRVESYLASKVEDLIEKAQRDSSNNKLPLVRLKVDYSGGYSTFSLARFGQKFLGKTANPKNLLLWHQHREKQVKKKSGESQILSTAEERAIAGSNITEYLEEEVSKERIDLLSCRNMTEALFEFVEKMENDSMSTCVKYSLEASQNLLKTSSDREEDLNSQMERQREELFKVQEVEGMSAVREELATSRRSRPDPSTQGSSSDDDDLSTSRQAPETSRGRARGRGSRGGGRGRSRGASASGGAAGTSSARGRGRGRGSRSKSKRGGGDANSSKLYPPVSPAPTTPAKRGSKRGIVYESDSDDDVFQNSRKRGKTEEMVDSIDLTQDSDDDYFASQSTRSSVMRPVRGSKRSKK